ncbi:FixH family protein [Geoalkalibacter sp.]|uniref:FixH family protein n=1 Tax=Geoalkalibacter sp. TaxID=3041440 RepID=UPI00272DD004|nr:FixH family protein [Geoalkalibacter sp.]
MQRPPFDSRIPFFIVIAGFIAVVVALGGFNLSLRGLNQASLSETGRPASEPRFPLEERAAAGLTWELSLSLDDHRLEARLRDPRGEPISGAQGRLTLMLNPQAPLDLDLRETAAGLYVVTLPDDLDETVEALIRMEQAENHIARSLLIAF